MSDIVDRLKAPAYWISGSVEGHEGENDAPREAAAEITALRAKLAEAAEVMRPFAECVKISGRSSWIDGTPSPGDLRRAAAFLTGLETKKAPPA